MESEKNQTECSSITYKDLESYNGRESKYLRGLMVWMVNNVSCMAGLNYMENFFRLPSLKTVIIVVLVLSLWFVTGSLIVVGIAKTIDTKETKDLVR